MRTIKNLVVKVTYSVEIEEEKVSDEVYEELNEIAENGGEVDQTEFLYPKAID